MDARFAWLLCIFSSLCHFCKAIRPSVFFKADYYEKGDMKGMMGEGEAIQISHLHEVLILTNLFLEDVYTYYFPYKIRFSFDVKMFHKAF